MSNVLQTFNNISYSKSVLENGEISLDISVSNERFSRVSDEVFKRLAPSVEISGFRAGKAPKNLIIAKLGASFYEEILKEIMPSCTMEVIKREELTPLTQLSYQVKKIAEGSGVEYNAKFTSFPEFKLPDFKKIKVTKDIITIDEKEIDNVLEKMSEEQKKKKKDFKMDDQWAASLNIGVKSVSELKDKIKIELEKQKKTNVENKYILDIIAQIAKLADLQIPQILVDSDLASKEEEYKQRITQLGLKVEDFLRNQKTTMDEVKKGWVSESKEKLTAEIILMKIAKEYNVTVDPSEVDAEISKIQDEKLKSQYQEVENRNYLQSVLIRQKIIQKLISLVEEK